MKFIFYFCLAMFLLHSCTEEKEFIENNSKDKYSIKEYNWKEANKILKFKEAQSKVMKSIKTNSNKTNSRELFGFEVDECVVKEISNGNYSSYNMLIVKELQSEEFFENLVIEIKGDTTNAYIVKYTPNLDSPTLDEHGHGDFEGTIEASKVYGQTCIICTDQSPNENGVVTGPNEAGGGPPTICITLYKCYTPDPALPNLSIPHLSYSGGCQQMPFQVCGAYGFGSISLTGLGNGPENPNAGPGNGALHGGSGVNTTTTSNPIVVPVAPLPKSTPCAELKKMTDNLAIRNSYTNPSTGLNSKVYQNIEYGFGFSKNEDGTDNCTPLSNDSANPSQLSIPVGGNNYGVNHTHPDASTTAVFPMFGPPNDIDYLYTVSRKSTISPKDYSLFVITLTVPDGTFALKIDDVLKFYAFKNNEKKYNRAMLNIEKLYGYCGEFNMDCLTKALLIVFKDNDAGLGLYKAEPDFSNWNKLSLSPLDVINPNSSNPIIKTPCK